MKLQSAKLQPVIGFTNGDIVICVNCNAKGKGSVSTRTDMSAILQDQAAKRHCSYCGCKIASVYRDMYRAYIAKSNQ